MSILVGQVFFIPDSHNLVVPPLNLRPVETLHRQISSINLNQEIDRCMFLEKSVLLARINSAIKRNDCLKKVDGHEHSELNGQSDQSPAPEQSELELVARVTIRKLEQRLEALEEQNDRLLYFIHYLYENLPVPSPPATNGISYPQKQPADSISNGSLKDQPTLTPRESEVLNLLVKGLCAKEIARILFICETTVITHKRNLKEKFQARNTVELISKTIHIISRG